MSHVNPQNDPVDEVNTIIPILQVRILRLKESSTMFKATVSERQDGLGYAVITNDPKISETIFSSDKYLFLIHVTCHRRSVCLYSTLSSFQDDGTAPLLGTLLDSL